MFRGAFADEGDVMREPGQGQDSLFSAFDPSATVGENFPAMPPHSIEGGFSENIFTIGFGWWRQLQAANLYQSLNCPGPVLEFAPSDGVLERMLPDSAVYHAAAGAAPLGDEYFSVIFAIGPLANPLLANEENIAATLARLFAALQPGGYLILSGPTGILPRDTLKWIAGLTPRRASATIYDIEYVAKAHGVQVRGQDLPGAYLPLSRLSVWQKRCQARISMPPV